MKVILLKDVAKVGQQGSVKEVSDGYALNFLIGRGLAVQATPEKIASHEATQKREGEARAVAQKALAVAVKSLEGARIEITVRATEKGGLFRSIAVADIVKAIADERKIAIPEDTVVLPQSLKQTGEHKVLVQGGDAKAQITLVIKPKI